jgi:hypothetical protein
MGKGRKLEKISLLALLILSLLVLAGFVPVRLGALSGVAEGILRDAGADSASAGEVSVTLFRGLRVKDVKTYKHISASEEYRVSVARADVSCNILSLALRVSSSPELLKPERDIFRELYESPLQFAGDISLQAMSLGSVKKVYAQGADVAFTHKGKEWISADGVSINIASKRKSLRGDLSANTVAIHGIAVVEGFSVKLFAGDGRLDLASGRGTVFGGKIGAELSLGLRDFRLIGGKARVEGLDLGKYCDGTGFPYGRLGGRASIDVQIEEGSPAALDSVRARGSFSAAGLSADNIAIQRAPAVSQLSKALRSLLFSEAAGSFELEGGKISFSEITGTGDVMSFKSAGRADFEGKLAQDFEGELSKEFVDGLPRVIRNSLERTPGGGGKFKCRITGTFHKPRVEVDKNVYKRAIRNIFK